LTDADLTVFDKEHPIPANALQGNEAVLKFLNLNL